VVGHFLAAEQAGEVGRAFWDGLRRAAATSGARLTLGGHRLLGFVEGRSRAPVLDYLAAGDGLHPLRVATRDTMLPYGAASLDGLAKQFLGVGKPGVRADADGNRIGLGDADKEDMVRTFRRRTGDAYAYAALDPVLTLLVWEAMQARDRDIYAEFGVPPERTPALAPTLGGRVATFLQVMTRETAAAGSELLKKDADLMDLLRRGGARPLVEPGGGSHYAAQCARVPGGLLFSRSPTRLAHRAPGMLADVDMSSCYLEITRGMSVYWGRPVVLEPGARVTTLKDAIEMVRPLAPDDGWLVYVTGPIEGYLNALIPSLEDAVTWENFKARRRRARRQAAQDAAQVTGPDGRAAAADDDREGTYLYTHQVDFGVVAWPTWLMIMALPPAARAQYEQLRVEAVAFYPRHLITGSGEEYDRLVRDNPEGTLPWEAVLDQDRWEVVERRPVRADHVSLRLPLGDIASRIKAKREEAKQRYGKGSAAELAWKQHGNTLYGVLGSPHKPTFNFVAANVITATARAKAWALSQVLNGIQTITDGVTYRRDQIPAGTNTDCLLAKATYPVIRAEEGEGIGFEDPATVPQGKEEFTRWFVAKAQRFFGVAGQDYERLFASHLLEHKTCGADKSPTFDVLCCDGAANYLKIRTVNDEKGYPRPGVEEFKARSYGHDSKGILQFWIPHTYTYTAAPSQYQEVLPPLAYDQPLLKLAQAADQARHALADAPGPVYFPLALPIIRLKAYKIVKSYRTKPLASCRRKITQAASCT
jgi:hypothetical protein